MICKDVSIKKDRAFRINFIIICKSIFNFFFVYVFFCLGGGFDGRGPSIAELSYVIYNYCDVQTMEEVKSMDYVTNMQEVEDKHYIVHTVLRLAIEDRVRT